MKAMSLLTTAIVYFIGLPLATQAMPVSAVDNKTLTQHTQPLQKSQKPPIVHKHNHAAQSINLNKADAPALVHAMKDVGKKKAEAIIHYREKNGPFKTFEDLSNVKGFSKTFIKKHLAKWQKVITLP